MFKWVVLNNTMSSVMKDEVGNESVHFNVRLLLCFKAGWFFTIALPAILFLFAFTIFSGWASVVTVLVGMTVLALKPLFILIPQTVEYVVTDTRFIAGLSARGNFYCLTHHIINLSYFVDKRKRWGGYKMFAYFADVGDRVFPGEGVLPEEVVDEMIRAIQHRM